MLEFVDSDLYFVQDKDNFINPLLQTGRIRMRIRGKKYRIRIRIRLAKNHRIRPDPDPHPCLKGIKSFSKLPCQCFIAI